MRTRHPAVSGQFYPSDKLELVDMISSLAGKIQPKKEEALGVISPHAGYIYSGAVAASVFSRVDIKDTVIILGPNHTGMGEPFSIETKGAWSLPAGEVKIDEELASEILKNSKFLTDDNKAGAYEHSIETQIPFIQYFKKDFKIIPMIIAYNGYDTLSAIGIDIAKVLKRRKKDFLIVASSDMTHYESSESAEKKDKLAINNILKLDPLGLYETVQKKGITMCGIAPAVVMLTILKELGAKEANLIKYQTSGDVSGDYSSVVGYAGIIIR